MGGVGRGALSVVGLVGVLSTAVAMVEMYFYSVSIDSYVVNLTIIGVVLVDKSSRVVEYSYVKITCEYVFVQVEKIISVYLLMSPILPYILPCTG